MDWTWILILFVIGFLGSFISGMVGIGGSIINYPMLLLLPPALGFAAFSAQEVSAISAVQVFVASTMASPFGARWSKQINTKALQGNAWLNNPEALTGFRRKMQRK